MRCRRGGAGEEERRYRRGGGEESVKQRASLKVALAEAAGH